MLPLVTIPGTIRAGLTPYREVFCREEGFDHISRYVTGLLLSPNKTLQGIYDCQIWGKERRRVGVPCIRQDTVGEPSDKFLLP
jgi:hypothetical protein